MTDRFIFCLRSELKIGEVGTWQTDNYVTLHFQYFCWKHYFNISIFQYLYFNFKGKLIKHRTKLLLNIEWKQTSFISKTLFHPVISQHWCRISLLFAESIFLFVYILKWQLVNVYKKSYIRYKYSCTSCSFHVTVSDIKQNLYFRGPSCELVGHVILKLNKWCRWFFIYILLIVFVSALRIITP